MVLCKNTCLCIDDDRKKKKKKKNVECLELVEFTTSFHVRELYYSRENFRTPRASIFICKVPLYKPSIIKVQSNIDCHF